MSRLRAKITKAISSTEYIALGCALHICQHEKRPTILSFDCDENYPATWMVEIHDKNGNLIGTASNGKTATDAMLGAFIKIVMKTGKI